MILRGAAERSLRKLLCSTSLQASGIQERCATVITKSRWISSLGSGFDGSSFSDEEDNQYEESHYEKSRRIRLGYGEHGSVKLSGNDDAAIDEWNKELEDIFGAVLPSQLGTTPDTKGVATCKPQIKAVTSTLDKGLALDPAETCSNVTSDTKHIDQQLQPPSKFKSDAVENLDNYSRSQDMGLSHVDSSGKAAMVNVAKKGDTKRVAVASGRVLLGPHAFALVAANNITKGDVLTVAKIAGITGAKQTGDLIPLCHNLLLSGVEMRLGLNEGLHAVDIQAEVTTVGPTGVEMEALTAVSIASLTIYDMCKAVSKDIQISDIKLEIKTGGKSGDWYRQQV